MRSYLVPCLLLLCCVGHTMLYLDNAIDDAYISYRYARSLAQGHGLTFNPGQRVEGFSNPLWVFFSAFFHLLRVKNPHIPMQILGILFSFGTVWILFLLARRIFPPEHSTWAWLPPFLLVSQPAWAFYATSGLETPLYVFWLTLSLYLLWTYGLDWRIGLVMGLASITRPEAPYIFCLLIGMEGFVGKHLGRPWAWRRALEASAVFSLFLGGWVLFRWLYFGQLFPNTYYAKKYTLLEGWLSGTEYILLYFRKTYALSLTAFFFVLFRRQWLFLFIGIAWGLAFAPLLRLGYDWMPLYRFFYQITPFEILLWTGGLYTAWLWLSRFVSIRQELVVGFILIMLCAFRFNISVTAKESFMSTGRAIRTEYKWLGKWLAQQKGTRRIALVDVGSIAYYAQAHIIDLAGLTDAHIARQPGHLTSKKFDGRYVLDQKPEFILLHTGRQARWHKQKKYITMRTHDAFIRIDLTRQPFLQPKDMFQVERNIFFQPAFHKHYTYVASWAIRKTDNYVFYVQHIFRRNDFQLTSSLFSKH